MNTKRIITVYGLSGAGKDYVIKNILTLFPGDFHFVRSWVTRPKRSEYDDHIFVSRGELHEQISKEIPVAYTEYGGFEYALFESEMHKTKINIRPIDPLGIFLMKKYFGDKMEIFTLRVACSNEARFKRCFLENTREDIVKDVSVTKKVLDRLEREKAQYEYGLVDKADLVFLNDERSTFETEMQKFIKAVNKKWPE